MRSILSVQKSEVVSSAGMVVAMHPLAVEAGAAVLRGGGNAVDAAVTMSFALSVVEPCMSGLGGGGAMVIYSPSTGTQCTIDHNMRAPLSASPTMFDLLPDASPKGFYGWPAVRDNANIVGYQSVAVPGSVAGMCRALERFGTIDLDQALRPAIALAEQGFPVDWSLTLHLAAGAREMRQFPDTTAIFFKDGLPLISEGPEGPDYLRQRDLARTLSLLAKHGPDVFYQGEIAQRIASAMATHGGLLTAQDMAEYSPQEVVHDALPSYRGHPIVGVLKGSGSTTTLELLKILEQFPLSELGHNSAAAVRILAEVFNRGFVDRFSQLDTAGPLDVPTDLLWSEEYAKRIATEIRDNEYARTSAMTAVPPPGHTTHLAAMDRKRTSVALTQTLLSRFGSMVVIPETGIVLNNGMMWFDPSPGRANSVAGGKRCLSAISPLILLDREQSLPFLVVGASGGRKIMTAVTQVISNIIDHRMGVQEAIAAPRIHRELGEILMDARLSDRLAPTLRAQGYQVLVQEETYASGHFGLASAIGLRQDTGTLHSGVEPLKYGMAIGV